jgi:hypothetical protein
MHLPLLRIVLTAPLILTAGQLVYAEDFAIQIASPVAAQSYQMKRSAFVFRTTGCTASSRPEVTATAEGLVSAKRRTLPLKVTAAPTSGVYGVFREWPEEGLWIVNITAHCATATAGALVATNGKTFVRESSVFLTRQATERDIESALKAAPRE